MSQNDEAPEKIYLQVGEDGYDALDEMTWCADRIEGYDIEYVRADTIESLSTTILELQAREERLREAANKVLDARNAEASAAMTYENAQANFSSSDKEFSDYVTMMSYASKADGELKDLLSTPADHSALIEHDRKVLKTAHQINKVYQSCAKHMGQRWPMMQAKALQPITICPICEQELGDGHEYD